MKKPKPSRRTKADREFWDFVLATAAKAREQERKQGWEFLSVTISDDDAEVRR
jgi:hypothetical protein